MAIDLRRVSREFKAKLKELKNMGPATRMYFCMAKRDEFNGRSLADVYGWRKLESQEWRIPEDEFLPFQAWRAQQAGNQQPAASTHPFGVMQSPRASGEGPAQPGSDYAIEFNLRTISPELKAQLMELKNMSPTQRFNVVSRPLLELKWRTVAAAYGMEKLERQQWIIPDQEFEEMEPPRKQSSTEESGDPAAKTLTAADGGDGNGIGPSDTLTAQTGASVAVEPGIGPSTATQERWEKKEGGQVMNEQVMNGHDEDVEVEPTSGIPIAHLAMLPQDEALRLINERQAQRAMRASANPGSPASGNSAASGAAPSRPEPQRSQWELGRDAGEKHGREIARHEIEKELRASLGLPDYWQEQPKMIDWHRQQLAKLDKANAAVRCEKVFADGTRCGCPRMNGFTMCYAHERAYRVRPKKLKLMLMEDANAVIMNIAIVQQGLLDGQITTKESGQLFYSCQTAASVLDKVTLKETKSEEMVKDWPEYEELPEDPDGHEKEEEEEELTPEVANSPEEAEDTQASGDEAVETAIEAEDGIGQRPEIVNAESVAEKNDADIPGDELNKCFVSGDEGDESESGNQETGKRRPVLAQMDASEPGKVANG